MIRVTSSSISARKASCLHLKTSRVGEFTLPPRCSLSNVNNLLLMNYLPSAASRCSLVGLICPRKLHRCHNQTLSLFFFKQIEVSVSHPGLFLLPFHHFNDQFHHNLVSQVSSQELCQNPTKDVPSAKMKCCAPAKQSAVALTQGD